MVAWVIAAAATAQADDWRVGGGFGGGVSPLEPSFGAAAGPAPTLTLSGALWRMYGGVDRVGPRGRVHHGFDPRRLGIVGAGGFATGRGGLRGQQGAAGLGIGGQWGAEALYVTAWSGVGFGSYVLADEIAGLVYRYESVGPWVRPTVGVGAQLADHVAIEAGPYASLIVPLGTAFHNGVPEGRYLGQVGVEVTVLIGVADGG